MCGILGLFAPDGVRISTELFGSALMRMRVRGPDDSGVWRDANAWLGHRRLAVMDTSMAGHQPMESDDGRYVLLFNGAIYNHMDIRAELGSDIHWRGTCDTETLLVAFARWGMECLHRLDGMFAFAVWDRQDQSLYLARDRLGVKPLYYSLNAERLVFASRPTAAELLLSDNERGIDHQSLRHYLECGFIPGQQSLYRGLKKFPPAHYLVHRKSGTRLVRYWDYRHISPDPSPRSEEDSVIKFDELFDSAVKRRLISDVPLGLFLSSGVDSALVASAMTRIEPGVHKAFTMSFSETAYDEGPMTQKIADHLGLELVTERLSPDGLLTTLPDYFTAIDEPIADSAGIATLALARAARSHITVALTGDGGDELFGGYPHYLRMKQLSPMLQWPRFTRLPLQMWLRHIPGHNSKLVAGALAMRGDIELFHYIRSMSKDFVPLITHDVEQQTIGSCELFEQCAASMALDLDPRELGARLDMSFTLPDLYLQKLDMATMAHSLEARSPFMDHRLVEWALRLPINYKYEGSNGKAIIKKALSRRLPAEWVYRPKRGFSVPIGRWLQGPLREWAQDSLRDSCLTSLLPINWPQVRTLLDQQIQGKRSSYPLVWAVLMLVEFLRHHGAMDIRQQRLDQAA